MKTSLTRALAQTVDGPSARPGRWLLGVWSVGELLAGFVSADPPGHWNEPPSLTGMVHGNAALLALTAVPVGALLLVRSFRRDRRWQPTFAVLSLLAVAAAISLIAFVASLIANEGIPSPISPTVRSQPCEPWT
jgi:O-antigen ligase